MLSLSFRPSHRSTQSWRIKLSTLLLFTLLQWCGTSRVRTTPKPPCTCKYLTAYYDADQDNQAQYTAEENKRKALNYLDQIIETATPVILAKHWVSTNPVPSSWHQFGRIGDEYRSAISFLSGRYEYDAYHLNTAVDALALHLHQTNPVPCDAYQQYNPAIQAVNSSAPEERWEENRGTLDRLRRWGINELLCRTRHDLLFPLAWKELYGAKSLLYQVIYWLANSQFDSIQTQQILETRDYLHSRQRTALQEKVYSWIYEWMIANMLFTLDDIFCKIRNTTPLSSQEEQVLSTIKENIAIDRLSDDGYEQTLVVVLEYIRSLVEYNKNLQKTPSPYQINRSRDVPPIIPHTELEYIQQALDTWEYPLTQQEVLELFINNLKPLLTLQVVCDDTTWDYKKEPITLSQPLLDFLNPAKGTQIVMWAISTWNLITSLTLDNESQNHCPLDIYIQFLSLSWSANVITPNLGDKPYHIWSILNWEGIDEANIKAMNVYNQMLANTWGALSWSSVLVVISIWEEENVIAKWNAN